MMLRSATCLLLVVLAGCGQGGHNPDGGGDGSAAFDVVGKPDVLPDGVVTSKCVHPKVVSKCAAGWCTVPAGCYLMGSPSQEPGRGYDEEQHPVTLTRTFEVGQTEVKQGRFKTVLGYNPSGFAKCGEACPVETVSWHEAVAYCNRLSSLKGLKACYSCTGAGAAVTCQVVEPYVGLSVEQDLYAIWGGGAEVWVVGAKGDILRRSGGKWTRVTSGLALALEGVWGCSKGVWIVGESGTILHHDGKTLSTVTSPVKSFLRAIWGGKADDIWIAGAGGTLLHYDGLSWSKAASPVTTDLNAIHGCSSASAWAVGDGGVVLRFDGSKWSKQMSGTKQHLYAVWASCADAAVWAVGAGGSILRWQAGVWTSGSSGTKRDLYALWGSSTGELWAGGEYGTLLRFKGGKWTATLPGSASLMRGLWGTAASNIYAVGSVTFAMSSPLLRFDGASWSKVELSTSTIYDCPGYRLPTEAEWEYACRAGVTAATYAGPVKSSVGVDKTVDKIAWYQGNSGGRTHAVGKKLANGWGLYDMAGNVGEFVHDAFYDFLGYKAVTDPVRRPGTGNPAIRGGGYALGPALQRSAKRFWYTAPTDTGTGFRCARSLAPSKP